MSVPMRVPGAGPEAHIEGRERRRFERVESIRPVRVFRDRSIHERVGISKDVSLGGMLFRTRAKYEVGERIWISWSRDDGDSGVPCMGTVVRTGIEPKSRGSEFPRMVAVEFEVLAAA